MDCKVWPKAILLDMDDTILAFDQVADESWIKVCHRFSEQIPSVAPMDVVQSIKAHARWFWSDAERHQVGRMDLQAARRQIVTATLHTFGISDVALADQIAYEYGIERDLAVKPFPGAMETLVKLRDLGIRLALLTNGAAESQRNKVERFGLEPLFDCILIEGEFGVGKPKDEIYLAALSALDVRADEVWMIGDHFDWEVVAPERLGIRSIWIDHKGEGCPPKSMVQPYRIIHTLSDIWTFESARSR